MSKVIDCPKCKDEIYSLNYSGEEKIAWGGTATFDGKHKILDHDQDYSSDEFPREEFRGDVKYTCPECEETLFTNEREATKYWEKHAKEESD